MTKGAISQARGRVGAAPLRQLYREQVHPLGPSDMPSVWHGDLQVMALDGCFSALSANADPSVPKSVRIRLPRGEVQEMAAEAYIADISRLNNSGLDSRGGFAMILVDPDRSGIVDLTNVATLFGLTRSEAAVCELVVKGYTNNEIADTRNVSPETVITQVKSLFAKTNSHRRGDLIHLAHSVNIPVGPK